jgi:hypothetical protein
MRCPYCLGDVPGEARKCMHCGEWLKTPPRNPSTWFGRLWNGGMTTDDVVEGVRWYVKYRIVMSVVGAVIGIIAFIAIASSWSSEPFGSQSDEPPVVLCNGVPRQDTPVGPKECP